MARPHNFTAPKRIDPDRCCGAIIDVQAFFLAQIDKRLRTLIETNTGYFARLLGHLGIPMVVTLERPLDYKGVLPRSIGRHLSDLTRTFEKDFFDLTKEKDIIAHLGRLKKKQVIVAGCETDVCVMQSCLGLIARGYEVFVMEELLFSSTSNVDSAVDRMRSEGAVFLTYKTLYYELLESVETSRPRARRAEALGPLPDDLPDTAVA
jgi:nicotinamidase-related amidase